MGERGAEKMKKVEGKGGCFPFPRKKAFGRKEGGRGWGGSEKKGLNRRGWMFNPNTPQRS